MAQAKATELRKITTKEIGWTRADVQAAAIKAGKAIQLYTLIGVVNGVKPGSTSMGDFAKLLGEFEAVNLSTGETFHSGTAILPNFIGDNIAAAVMRGAESVQFAITVSAKPDEKSVAGFVYAVESGMAPSEHSPLAQLRNQVREQKLLPSPKK